MRKIESKFYGPYTINPPDLNKKSTIQWFPVQSVSIIMLCVYPPQHLKEKVFFGINDTKGASSTFCFG